jgi:eukaryotic-like serine/threonine-protein kinase
MSRAGSAYDSGCMTPTLSTPGMVIGGKYRLERKLGQGGMGVVWLARVPGELMPVAVKLLDLSGVDRHEALERFHREALAPAKINHPGIIEVRDIGTEEGMPYLVMEYLEGFTLSELTREGPLPPRVVSAVMSPVLEALAAAHKAGILHRDLKPPNVMLVETPKKMVKLLDFGVARYAAALRPVTQTGAIVGTPNYMSPEQVKGQKELTTATDLYSAGVMLFELFTGRRLFQQDSLHSLMSAVVNEPPPPIATVLPDLPPALCVLIDSLLLKDPATRPQDARAVRDKLVAIMPPDEHALWALAFPQTSVERREGSTQVRAYVPPAKQRRSPWPWVGLSAALVLIAGALLVGWRSEQAKTAQRVAEEKPAPLPIPPPTPAPPAQEVVPEAHAPPPTPCTAASLDRARQSIRSGDLTNASAELAACRNKPGTLDRALLLVESQLKEEADIRRSLDRVEEALQENPPRDGVFNTLHPNAATRAFHDRYVTLHQKLIAAGAEVPNPTAMRAAARTRMSSAEAALKRKDVNQADGEAQQCKHADPTFAGCYRVYALVHQRRGEAEKAAIEYERFIELSPKGDPAAKVARQFVDAWVAAPH